MVIRHSLALGPGRYSVLSCTSSKSRDYKERQVDMKKRKVFVTAHVILRTAAMFLASALYRGSHLPEILKMGSNSGGNTSV